MEACRQKLLVRTWYDVVIRVEQGVNDHLVGQTRGALSPSATTPPAQPSAVEAVRVHDQRHAVDCSTDAGAAPCKIPRPLAIDAGKVAPPVAQCQHLHLQKQSTFKKTSNAHLMNNHVGSAKHAIQNLL